MLSLPSSPCLLSMLTVPTSPPSAEEACSSQPPGMLGSIATWWACKSLHMCLGRAASCSPADGLQRDCSEVDLTEIQKNARCLCRTFRTWSRRAARRTSARRPSARTPSPRRPRTASSSEARMDMHAHARTYCAALGRATAARSVCSCFPGTMPGHCAGACLGRPLLGCPGVGQAWRCVCSRGMRA